MTSSSPSTDTFYDFEQHLLAFHGEIVSPDGKVVAGEAKNREAIVKTLSFFRSSPFVSVNAIRRRATC
jgi:hypothetical protein